MYEITKHLNCALKIALDDMDGSEVRFSTMEALALNHEETIRELRQDRDEWETAAKRATDKCLEPKEELRELKNKRLVSASNTTLVLRDLFGDGYVYADNIGTLRKNIKKKIDRHEKTKQENAELKKERDGWKDSSEAVAEMCIKLKQEIDKLKADNGKLEEKVAERDRGIGNWARRGKNEKAKASKLNAEKRKLLGLLSGHGTSAEVRRDYTQYLKDSAKKGKK